MHVISGGMSTKSFLVEVFFGYFLFQKKVTARPLCSLVSIVRSFLEWADESDNTIDDKQNAADNYHYVKQIAKRE